jgi:hypothetical protein
VDEGKVEPLRSFRPDADEALQQADFWRFQDLRMQARLDTISGMWHRATVPISAPYDLTDCRRFFAEPATARQRQYEALRAFYLENLPSAEVARRFGYAPGAFRVLCHAFRHGDLPELFAIARPGRREQPKKSRAHEQIVALRKRNYSVYEISETLKEQGMPLSATAVREVLAVEGFAPLPRRLDEERPVRVGPNAQAVANVGDFVLTPREFTTQVGGLFLFVPDLVRLAADALAHGAKLPGSRMIPAAHALRASLALKLWAIERKSHVMALVADEGLALFCGLNAMPKKSFLSEYSSRIIPQKVSRLLALWHTQLAGESLVTGQSLNLDFHSVPYFGEHPLVESHYLSKRSRRQPSILAFLAQDADSQVFCYSNADIRKGEEADEIFRFIAFWKRQYGKAPNTSSSTPSSQPTKGSIGSMPPASPSSPCAAARPAYWPKSIACRHRRGAPSCSTCPTANTALRASTNRGFVRANAPIDSSSSPTSVTMSPPYCSPMTTAPPPKTSSPATPSACSSRTPWLMPCASSTSMHCPRRSASRSTSTWRSSSSHQVSIA